MGIVDSSMPASEFGLPQTSMGQVERDAAYQTDDQAGLPAWNSTEVEWFDL
jgi:hypothetical protein